MMDGHEARRIMAVRRWGDPPATWAQHRTVRGMVTMEFGVVDPLGAAIVGQHVELAVMRSQRLAQQSIKFTLFAFDGSTLERVYQLDINGRSGLRPGDHDFPHEHIGSDRIVGAPDWNTLGLRGALALFCQRCTLTIDPPVPDIDDFALRP